MFGKLKKVLDILIALCYIMLNRISKKSAIFSKMEAL